MTCDHDSDIRERSPIDAPLGFDPNMPHKLRPWIYGIASATCALIILVYRLLYGMNAF